jgi:hypothetical protein
VFHAGIVPEGLYEVRAIGLNCDPGNPASFSTPLALGTSSWGDVAAFFHAPTSSWPPPDGRVDVTADILALLDKFANRANAPSKARVDLEPATPDRMINITDVTQALGAFQGLDYPFSPGPAPCP